MSKQQSTSLALEAEIERKTYPAERLSGDDIAAKLRALTARMQK